jgi:hypothetical protein
MQASKERLVHGLFSHLLHIETEEQFSRLNMIQREIIHGDDRWLWDFIYADNDRINKKDESLVVELVAGQLPERSVAELQALIADIDKTRQSWFHALVYKYALLTEWQWYLMTLGHIHKVFGRMSLDELEEIYEINEWEKPTLEKLS